MSMMGHNQGPASGPGTSWRRHCWSRARAELLPTLPIEILRGRVRRARELGLDYTTYASVRASTGRDVIGFLFSSNALHVFSANPVLPAERVAKLAAISKCASIVFVSRPMTPEQFTQANPAQHLAAVPAPGFVDTWGDTRSTVLLALRPEKLPADAVLLVGDTTLERTWSEAGRLAGYLPAERYFGARAM